MISVNTNGHYTISLDTDTRWVRVYFKGVEIDTLRLPLSMDILDFHLRFRHGDDLMEMGVCPNTVGILTATIREVTDARTFPGIEILSGNTTLELVPVIVT